MNDKERFFSKLEKVENGCWEWRGSFFKGKKYGQFYMRINGRDTANLAHRAAWKLLIGPIESTDILCHRCNNPACVNPEHLYVGTHQTNADDRERAGRTSRGEHRYNFKRNAALLAKIVELRTLKYRVEEILEKLGIGKTTYYRVYRTGHIPADINAAARSANCHQAQINRG